MWTAQEDKEDQAWSKLRLDVNNYHMYQTATDTRAFEVNEYSDQAAELISIDPVKEETQTVPQRTIQDHLGEGVILVVVMVLDIFF